MRFVHIAVFLAWWLPMAVPASWAAGFRCEPNAQLALRVGHYAKKSLWENLATQKVWSKANQRFNDGWISAVDIDKMGNAFANLGWHEGGTPCITFRGEELWAADTSAPPAKWEGPYIRVSASTNGETIYFNRIFGNKCYSSKAKEHWCFGDGQITIGKKRFKAFIQSDMSEAPEYGTPVNIDGNEGFLVFVPFQGGWKVFKDTFVTAEGRKDIDPAKTPPWLILSPIPQ